MHKETFERDQVVEIVGKAMQSVAPPPQYEGLMKSLEEVTQKMRSELEATGPGHILGLIQGALDELSAIRSTTESAADAIMSECDKGENADITKILEACTFQDMTGQRAGKVEKTLQKIDEYASTIASTIRSRFADLDSLNISSKTDEVEGDGGLMGGPQLPDKALSQEEIDKLLDSF